MDGLVCDRCGKSLLVDEPVRYRMDLQITAAYDAPEITPKDLEGDLQQEISDVIEGTEGVPVQKLEDEVAAQRRYDLCPPCGRVVLENPFGRGA